MSDNGSGPAVRIRGLTKDFSIGLRGVKLRAVDHLDLEIGRNEIFGLLGPNGSGKSTTIKILLGLARPTQGECAIFGRPAGDPTAREKVGYLPESPYFHRYLTGRELVAFYGRICGLAPARLRQRTAEVLALVGMSEAADRRVGTYSKGMLQRIGLAQALVHDPELVVLDEPTAGVDPVGSAEIAALVLALKREGRTVLLSSHLLAQVEGICDRIAILHRGRLILQGRVEDLMGEPGRECVMVRNLAPSVAEELRSWLAARGATLEGIERPRQRLDRVFLEHVTRSEANARRGTA